MKEKFPDNITYGEKYGPAMTITDTKEATEYFELCVEHTIRVTGKNREAAADIERANLGYWAGYYDNETRERVGRLFNCAHPIFGAIKDTAPPTPEEAFRLGQELATPPITPQAEKIDSKGSAPPVNGV